MRLNEYPARANNVTLTTYAISATAADDTITVASNTKLQTGDEVVITLDGGTAQGITSGNTYYVVRVDATNIKIATTRANAIAGTPTVVDIAGDAGAGDVYPVYSVDRDYDTGMPCAGFLHAATGGHLRVKPLANIRDGDTNWITVYMNNGSWISTDIGAIHTYPGSGNTLASDVSVWYGSN